MAGYFGIHDLIATGDLGYGYCQHVLGQLLILLTALPTVQISQTDLSLSFTPFNYLLQWGKCCL